MSDAAIRLPDFSLDGKILAGELPLVSLPRFCRQLPGAPGPGVMLGYRLSGGCGDDGCLFLKVALSVQLPLVCTRCLEAFEYSLATEQRFWVRGGAEPAAGADIGEELEAGEMSLAEFLTDELLLSLPAAPMHAPSACRATAFLSTH